MSTPKTNKSKPGTYAANPRSTALKQNSLSEAIFQDIRGRLQAGEFGQDDRLLDYEIAEEFGCTRMPVRQAMLRLVNDGYLVGTTRGFLIPRLTRQDLLEIFEMRRLLEPRAAASAIGAMTEERLGMLNRVCRQARRALEKGDSRSLIEAAFTFRQTWVEAVSNSRLKATIEKFVDHAQAVRRSTLIDPAVQEVAVTGMQSLLDAFTSASAARIEETMTEFLIQAEYALITHIPQDQDEADPAADGA
jgi:DNA-binding GntR family transcriptional regulator